MNRVSEKSKAINKKQKNKNKGKKGGAPPVKGAGQQQQQKKGQGQQPKVQQAPGVKASKKNRRQRLQAKLSAKPRSPMSQSRAYKAEMEMSKTNNKVVVVKLPDPVVSGETVKGWSTGIENALFPKPVGPRSFLIVLKDDVDVKKEIEKLKKVSFGNGKLMVEEKKMTEQGKVPEGHSPADFIDPYTLYLTNLDESVTREDLQKLFPGAKTVMSPKKHNPRSGTPSKFAFVGFETAEAALEGFQLSRELEKSQNAHIPVPFVFALLD